ncbi:MAG: SDR family oxidoreductase, partial [Deltaproteobacteria bacterium]|nr:SDR family oxidoreductase [Deltaproteobacteria bacterium]
MKCVVITGSTKGIGLGLAKEFLQRDCAVVASGRNKERLEDEVRRLAAGFGDERVLGRACDVTDYDQVRALWHAARQKFDEVDIWINNAGIDNTILPYWEMASAEISPVVSTNLTGMMFGCHVALKGMQSQRHGQIYNVEGYGSNDMMRTGFSVYGATKRALRYFTESLTQEAEALPVQIGCISPGIVLTDFMIDGLRKLPADQLEAIKAIYNTLADSVETV